MNKPELVEKLLESSQCNEKFLFNDFLQLETSKMILIDWVLGVGMGWLDSFGIEKKNL